MAGTSMITLQEFAKLLDRNLTKILVDYLSPARMVSQRLFTTMSTNRLTDEFMSVGNVPDIPKFSGKVEYVGISPGFWTKIENTEFAGGLQIERRLIDVEDHRIMKTRQERLADALRRTKEKKAANVFNYAFSTAWEFMANEEGVALCGNHTTKSGVPTTTGFTNFGTSALSKTAVAATRVAMMKFKDDIGEYIDNVPDLLIVPVSLYDAACEIVGYDPRSGASSQLDPTSANNAINVLWKGFEVIPWVYLDSFSTTNWFMVSSNYMKDFLIWVDRIKQESHTIIDYETMSIKQLVYSSFGCGFLDWRWIFGHVV